MRVPSEGLIPAGRYTSRAFLEAEMERLWSRVWQAACRVDEVAGPGDFVEYTIGDQSILVVRSAAGELSAFHNACLHRGTRLARDCGTFADGHIRCPYHAWRYDLSGRLVEIVDAHEFGTVPAGLALRPVQVDCWGGFVFVNPATDAEPLAEFLDPLPELLASYHLERMPLRSYRSTILPANWKVVIDAFNEAYHVQGTHPQLLAWTDDVHMEYEQFRTHAHYGRLASSRRELVPSPRLGLAEGEYDEGEILAHLVEGLSGLFFNEERELVERVRSEPVPEGETLLSVYQQRRREMLVARGVEVEGFTDDQLTSADDVYWFPNMVGPIYPGAALVFRARPNGLDPDSSIMDTWVLSWPRGEHRKTAPAQREFYANWRNNDWGPITTQDYENMARVQEGMKSWGFAGLRCNPRQESNIVHMHRVIDRYLFGLFG